MFLARSRITELAAGDPPLFEDKTFDPERAQQSSYDLRLGGEAYARRS